MLMMMVAVIIIIMMMMMDMMPQIADSVRNNCVPACVHVRFNARDSFYFYFIDTKKKTFFIAHILLIKYRPHIYTPWDHALRKSNLLPFYVLVYMLIMFMLIIFCYQFNSSKFILIII